MQLRTVASAILNLIGILAMADGAIFHNGAQNIHKNDLNWTYQLLCQMRSSKLRDNQQLRLEDNRQHTRKCMWAKPYRILLTTKKTRIFNHEDHEEHEENILLKLRALRGLRG